MKKITLILTAVLFGTVSINAQEQEYAPLVLSGSVDTYYKYDFAKASGRIPTSFAGDHNSFSLGMVNLIFSKEFNKVSFVADVSFGPRSANSLPVEYANIQNMYASYALCDAASVSLGYMGTFVGYEVISPVDNFNYSTSYLFSYGPFQNAGAKIDISLGDNIDLMVGAFNDLNQISNTGFVDLGAQLHIAPSQSIDLYINYLNSADKATEDDGDLIPSFDILDLTAGFQLTDKLYVGLNAAKTWLNDNDGGNYFKLESKGKESGYYGVALYPQYAINDVLSLGLRYEYFEEQNANATISSFTGSANISLGELTLIPEYRFDYNGDQNLGEGFNANAAQASLAAVYSF